MGHRSVLYELNINLTSEQWGVSCPVDQSLIGPVQYGWNRYQQDPESMTFGGGLLAGSPLHGTRRMIICGFSPQWEGFYVSAIGGVMYVLHRVGINYIWLRGKSKKDIVIVIRLKDGEYSVKFEQLEPEKYWGTGSNGEGEPLLGFYGLQNELFNRYRSEFDGDNFRILTVGPAARLTKEGAIGSNQIRHNAISPIDDWAGRGGLGSRLLQHHGVAGFVFGGDWEDPALKEAKELDEYFIKHFGQKAIASDLALSQKYRYVPEFETGGTFGVNMHTAEDRLFSYNYQSIYASDQERTLLQDDFILQHYLKQFNEETIKPKHFYHCGEPCAIACKKFIGEYKKDYEPYEALGPNCGIFDQRAAEKLNKFIDSMGADTIQTGGTIAWFIELLSRRMVPPADFGIDIEAPSFNFCADRNSFDIVRDSMKNALLAIKIYQMMLFSRQGEPFRKGIRSAAKWLDQKYGINSLALAVYNAHGTEGCMVPNQYWVPGMFAPMPLMGKYFSYYGSEFIQRTQGHVDFIGNGWKILLTRLSIAILIWILTTGKQILSW
jgi:glyceraldehyde-3-phosphate dehydrogenase (ferredoxin)